VTLIIKSLAEWRAEQQARAAAEAPPERPGQISFAANPTAKAA
jgi:sulfate transport system permease protein